MNEPNDPHDRPLRDSAREAARLRAAGNRPDLQRGLHFRARTLLRFAKPDSFSPAGLAAECHMVCCGAVAEINRCAFRLDSQYAFSILLIHPQCRWEKMLISSRLRASVTLYNPCYNFTLNNVIVI